LDDVASNICQALKGGDNMTALTHPSDTTMSFMLALLRGDYGKSVLDPAHLLVVVNGFWSGAGGNVGQPWEFGLKKEAKEVLGREGDWEYVYCCRRVRSAAGVRPDRYCSPRHSMQFDSRNEGSKCVG